MKKLYTKENNGFALLLAIIISSIVLAIGVSILKVSVNQINLSATARESEFAFQAAHAGIDCVSYWRTEKASEYTSQSASTPNPTINCFGENPTPTVKTPLGPFAGGTVYMYRNTFQWGSPERCSSVYMYVLNANSGNMSVPFTNLAVGNNGVKTCNQGTVCTVIESEGYNRACSDLGTSIFSVQRELTVEF